MLWETLGYFERLWETDGKLWEAMEIMKLTHFVDQSCLSLSGVPGGWIPIAAVPVWRCVAAIGQGGGADTRVLRE